VEEKTGRVQYWFDFSSGKRGGGEGLKLSRWRNDVGKKNRSIPAVIKHRAVEKKGTTFRQRAVMGGVSRGSTSEVGERARSDNQNEVGGGTDSGPHSG